MKTNRGFTLIEVMIAVGLFVTVVIIGITAVLDTNTTYKRTQAVRSILDNLNFVVEDMARNLRLGTNYHCGNQGDPSMPQDCEPLNEQGVIAFEGQGGDPADASDQIFYGVSADGNIQKGKKVGGATVYDVITPPEIMIDTGQSGFTVIGACPSVVVAGNSSCSTIDTIQPRVIIRLSGKVHYKNTDTPFSIETTVSQSQLD